MTPANVETMAYNGETPWHGLGTKVDHVMTAAEAVKLASLDWTVSLQPVFLQDGRQILGRAAVVRDTDGIVYGIPSDRYTPVQNSEAFSFFDAVVGTGEAKYHTVGSLGKGERIWMLAKLPEPMTINEDQVDKYVLLVNSHDGSQALQMLWTPIRVVCQNTLNIALTGKRRGEVFYGKHTPNLKNKTEQARDILGLANQFFTNFLEQAKRMAILALPSPEMNGFVRATLLFDPNKIDEEQHKFKREAAEMIYELVEVGRGQEKFKGTRWGAFNAVTEYVDHHIRVKSNQQRLSSAWFGNGAALKQRAWDYLVQE